MEFPGGKWRRNGAVLQRKCILENNTWDKDKCILYNVSFELLQNGDRWVLYNQYLPINWNTFFLSSIWLVFATCWWTFGMYAWCSTMSSTKQEETKVRYACEGSRGIGELSIHRIWLMKTWFQSNHLSKYYFLFAQSRNQSLHWTIPSMEPSMIRKCSSFPFFCWGDTNNSSCDIGDRRKTRFLCVSNAHFGA